MVLDLKMYLRAKFEDGNVKIVAVATIAPQGTIAPPGTIPPRCILWKSPRVHIGSDYGARPQNVPSCQI